ncbi:hypothetical protein CMI37_20100 [Candidatus Pacearchaeota archaeon]|nr:hypothetical protein [Candidatus Pacearchaeota archaeon]|tara:strand:- start:82 stop:1731 length:1650 start_codon:yes stop_codon:yes gene_type:complete
MSRRSWIKAVKSVKPLEVLEEAAQADIQKKLVAAGMGHMGDPKRVANQEPPLSSADFIKLIKKTFPGQDGQVPEVTEFKPLMGLNTSHSFSMFGFMYDGKINYIKLAGGSKGRGTKQTNEQETSWLLVLSAFYDTPDMQTKDASTLFDLCQKEAVYSRVYGNDGKALDVGKALGLVNWMGVNGGLPFSDGDKSRAPTGWVNSHIAQAKKFISSSKFGSTNVPQYFRKDKAKLPIVNLAKQLFPTSVPDQKFDKDKWNPADVWIEYSDYVLPVMGPKGDYKLTHLNNYLLESIENKRGILGVSLKLGKGEINSINMTERPEYIVDDFKMQYGDFFAQNVSSIYGGNELEGYSVTYRLFSASATETIRGEAQKKKTLAAHGKVFLKYLDFLMGSKRAYVSRVESVKGVLIKETNPYSNKGVGSYAFTKKGKLAFKKITEEWPKLKTSDIIQYARGTDASEYDILIASAGRSGLAKSEKIFLDAVAQYAFDKKAPEKNMQTRISARFQTIRLGTLFAGIKKGSVDKLHQIALGMLLYGKSESEWSAPHVKAT